jgi:hypothetical protein
MAQPLTREDALELRLGELPGLWLEIHCACGVSTFSPCRRLAQERGARTRIGDVLSRLRCRACGRRPTRVALTDDATGGAPNLTGERPTPWKLKLMP